METLNIGPVGKIGGDLLPVSRAVLFDEGAQQLVLLGSPVPFLRFLLLCWKFEGLIAHERPKRHESALRGLEAARGFCLSPGLHCCGVQTWIFAVRGGSLAGLLLALRLVLAPHLYALGSLWND